jgi:hypothetical protein
MSIKIGLRDIAAMPPSSIIWDSQIKGFVARRQFSDVITYSVVYRTRDALQRWHKIGRAGVFTPALARIEAIKVLRSVALGEDPSAERTALRNSMDVSALCDLYSASFNSSNKKSSTIKSDNSWIKGHIKPKIGKHKVVNINRDMIEQFMYDTSGHLLALPNE